MLKIPIWEPYKLFKKLKGEEKLEQGVTPVRAGYLSRFIRGNIFIPDPRRFWVGPAVKFVRHFLKDRSIDAIVTTGPPHSMHLIGLKLHRKTNIPWIADFRDPWSNWDMLDQFNLTNIARNMHRSLERKVMRNASGTITVSKEWAMDFQTDYNILPEVLTNGFDEEDFHGTSQPDYGSFDLMHAGLLNSFRDSPEFWKVCARFFSENDVNGKVVLRGMLDSDIKDRLLNSSLASHLDIEGSVPHKEVIELYQKSFVLLLFMNNSQNASGHIPGKLFEYLAANRWILAIGDPNGASARIIRESGHGKVVAWDDPKAMKEALDEYFQFYREKRLPDPDTIRKYSRESLAQQLAVYLDEVTGQE